MTHDEIMVLIGEMGLPFAYDHFAKGESPKPPYLVFLYPRSSNFAADGTAYHKINRLNIELYSDIKSPKLETNIEAVLERHSIFYAKSEVWIESENLYEVLYEMEV
jgi:hypothetical protein